MLRILILSASLFFVLASAKADFTEVTDHNQRVALSNVLFKDFQNRYVTPNYCAISNNLDADGNLATMYIKIYPQPCTWQGSMSNPAYCLNWMSQQVESRLYSVDGYPQYNYGQLYLDSSTHTLKIMGWYQTGAGTQPYFLATFTDSYDHVQSFLYHNSNGTLSGMPLPISDFECAMKPLR